MGYKKEFLLLFITIFLFIILFEIFLSITNIETRLLINTLYYQVADPEVHRVSTNPNRLYELLPNSSHVYNYVHPNETKYQNITVTINSLGFRDKERNKIKPRGVFRIVVLGGSNTYGARVSDADTYPAIMQRIFDEYSPGKFEVWNAGISAYVLSQKVAYAEYIIKEFNPDLLIFQVGNTGRRGFLMIPPSVNPEVSGYTKQENINLFRKNKELYLENIPFLLFDNPVLKKIHYYFILHSRVYRFFGISINNIIVYHNYKLISKTCEDYKINKMADFFLGVSCRDNEVLDQYYHLIYEYSVKGSLIGKRDFDKFLKNNSNMKVVIFNPIPAYMFCDIEKYNELCKQNSYFKLHPPFCDLKAYEEYDITYFSLCAKNKSEEYYFIHPPSYVYEWYAKELVYEILLGGYVE